ncbi:MAG: carboxypeptidase regulatory-like domain-containing protein [Acidobacteriota bacterium]|nr:carboxypeptidase regulatory-like domain-containing protein [Acidobacteriota bacterium]
MKSKSTLFFALLLIISFMCLNALSLQASVRTNGALKGKITDTQGKPIKGAYAYVSSPSLIGIRYHLTKKTGDYFFLELPAGIYKLSVEAPGFILATINDIQIDSGKTINLPISLEPDENEEEKILLLPVPLLDSQSPRLSYVLDREILNHIPKTRDLAGIMGLMPGLVPEKLPADTNAAINGSSVRETTAVISGNEINDPFNRKIINNINPDWVEEVEVEAAAHPVESYAEGGAMINIITRDGANEASGQLNFLGTGGRLTDSLWNQDEIERMGQPPVMKEKYNLNFSLNLEGPILPDRVWYFFSFQLDKRSRNTPFTPWTDPANIIYPMYSWKNRNSNTLLHLSAQITPQINASLFLSYTKSKQNIDPAMISPKTPEAATTSYGQNLLLIDAYGHYALNPETMLNMYFYYTRNSLGRGLQPDSISKPRYIDTVSGYTWGSGPYNEDTKGDLIRIGVSATRFQSFLNCEHELVVGGEFQNSTATISTWKQNNLVYYYLNSNPYYYGQAFSPESGNLVGQGLVGFYLASSTAGGLSQKSSVHNLSFYARDTFSPVKRVSLYLGMKFERIQAGLASLYRGYSSTLSYSLGQELIRPVYGFNPYSAQSFPSWDNMLIWHNFSPRLGLVIDVFGHGRTLVKGSFSRYADHLSLSYLTQFSLGQPTGYHLFYWYDENGDEKADSRDTYRPLPEDYRVHQDNYYRQRIAQKLKAPLTTEWTATVEQQIGENFTLSLSYLSKTRTRIVEDVLYDPDSGQEWYTAEGSSSWWIPFNTIVPAGSGSAFVDTPVTVYFPSLDAPDFFTRLNNVSGLKQKYSGLQLVARRKMTGRWQMLSSLTWSKARGNVGLSQAATSAYSELFNSPNALVNISQNSIVDLDRPLVAKIMGSYRLPWDVYLSAFFSYESGAPWARTVTIVPPESWLEEHQAGCLPATVYLEPPGSRRWPDFKRLDIKIEKSFKLNPDTSLNVGLDILNLFGQKYGVEDLNDGGYWYPEAEEVSTGLRVISSSYQKILALYGTRDIQLNFSLRF